jgi:cytochrome c556
MIVRSPGRGPAEKDDRGLAILAQGQQSAEIGIGGNYDSIVRRGAIEDVNVWRRGKAVMSHMDGIVPGRAQTRCQNAREVIDQELHGVNSMGQLMKQAGFANNRIKRGLRRITDKADEMARDVAVLAAIAQATVYDTQAVKTGGRLDQWYQLCDEMRDGAGKLNAAIRAADKEGAAQASQELERSCNACHTAFRPAK